LLETMSMIKIDWLEWLWSMNIVIFGWFIQKRTQLGSMGEYEREVVSVQYMLKRRQND
jgi:hypothetical protein